MSWPSHGTWRDHLQLDCNNQTGLWSQHHIQSETWPKYIHRSVLRSLTIWSWGHMSKHHQHHPFTVVFWRAETSQLEHILITSQCLWTDFHVLSYDMFVHIVVRWLWFFLNDSEVLNKYSSSTPCWTLSYITVISVIYDNIAQNNLVIRLIDTDRNDLFLQFKPRSSGGMWLHLLHRCTSVQIWSNCTLVENFLCVLFYSTTSQRLILYFLLHSTCLTAMVITL